MRRVKEHRYLYSRSGWFWFRRAVPDDARSAFGRREVQCSLGTTNLAEARHSLGRELKNFEAVLSKARGTIAPADVAFRAAAREPTSSELEEGVRAWFTERIERAPGSFYGSEALPAAQAELANLQAHGTDVTQSMRLGSEGPALSTVWIAEDLIDRFNWTVQERSVAHRKLLRLIGRGQLEANERQRQDIEAEPRRVVDETFSADQYRLDEERKRNRASAEPLSLHKLFEGYVAERQPRPATVKAYRRHIDNLIEFLGHNDARRVTSADVVAWKDHLLTIPNAKGHIRAAKTVGETYLAAVKTVLGWAFDNHKLAVNPTTRVRVRSPRRHVLRAEKGLNDREAMIILRGTLLPPPPRLSPQRVFARRWVPWLCAYTGARVDEMAQLRAEDVRERRGVWSIRITPEAGGTKDSRARVVALHPHLIAQGFLKEVAGRSGFLFYDPSLHRGGSDGNPQSKKVGQHLARWVRNLGVEDVAVQPNHGWRHRFKSQARLVGMDPAVREFIQGHVPRTDGEEYGDTFPEVSLRAISLLPAYDVTGS